MASRANQTKFAVLALLALAGTVGTFIFGILAGEGGKYHLLIIFLGVLCASAPVVATAAGRLVTNRMLRTEVEARELPGLSGAKARGVMRAILRRPGSGRSARPSPT